MLKKMRERKKKLKKKLLGGGVTAACIIALLASWGLDVGGLGSGLGLPQLNDLLNPDDSQPEQQPNDPVDEVQPDPSTQGAAETEQTNTLLTITVYGDMILQGENPITTDSLRTLLETSDESYVWDLNSHQAILSTYNDVLAVFLETGVSFTETR